MSLIHFDGGKPSRAVRAALFRLQRLLVALGVVAGVVSMSVGSAGASTKASAPQDLTAARIGSGLVQLNWQPPTNTGGLPVTSYSYDLSINGGSTWEYTGINAGSATSIQDDNCDYGQSCTYRVRAYTDAGPGAYSANATAA